MTLTNGDKAKVKIPSLDTLQADVGKEMNDQMDKGTLKQEAYETKISWTAVTNIILIIVFICVFFSDFCEKAVRVQPILQRAEQDLMRTPRTDI